MCTNCFLPYNQDTEISNMSPLDYVMEQEVAEDMCISKKKLNRRKKDGKSIRKRAQNYSPQMSKEAGMCKLQHLSTPRELQEMLITSPEVHIYMRL